MTTRSNKLDEVQVELGEPLFKGVTGKGVNLQPHRIFRPRMEPATRDLWSIDDVEISKREGWCIRQTVIRPVWSISHYGSTFLNEDEAKAWVLAQAAKCVDPGNIYARALAVIASLEIEQTDVQTQTWITWSDEVKDDLDPWGFYDDDA